MTALLSKTITTAASGSLSSVFQRRDPAPPSNALIQANFTYGSGGTSLTMWVQTSLDGAVTWCDVACFQFVTTTARKMFNLSALTPVTSIATPTDGSLSANTSVDGIVGSLWRVKYTSVGTYAASTTIEVDFFTGRLAPYPNE